MPCCGNKAIKPVTFLETVVFGFLEYLIEALMRCYLLLVYSSHLTSKLEKPEYRLQQAPHSKSEWREEPSVLAALVSLLQRLLDCLLCLFPLADFLKCVVAHHSLQSLQF